MALEAISAVTYCSHCYPWANFWDSVQLILRFSECAGNSLFLETEDDSVIPLLVLFGILGQLGPISAFGIF